MSGPVEALAAQQLELTELVEQRSADELRQSSRCPGWSAADVLLHLAQTNEMAVASVEGRLDEYVASVAGSIPAGGDVDSWAGALVAAERDTTVAARDRYLASAGDQLDAFSRCDLDDPVRWVAGRMAARTLATTRLAETWIHTVDVAVALGVEVLPTDRLWHVTRLVWRTVPYALGRAGLAQVGEVAFEVAGPAGATWVFGDPSRAPRVVRGPAAQLCEVAGQREVVAATALDASGPDAAAVLANLRTFA